MTAVLEAAAGAEPSLSGRTQPVVLLGPQARVPLVAHVLEDLDLHGDVATVTAGWQEREDEVQELHEHLHGRSQNLGLYQRAERIFAGDPDLAAAHRARQDELRELQRLYDLRMGHAMDAYVELAGREGDGERLEEARREAMEAVRTLDAAHLQKIDRIHAAHAANLRLEERDALRKHREEVHEILDGCDTLAIAGGHVAVLLNRLRLFGVLEHFGDRPVVGWSAGAMVLGERVVLYHDTPPQGAGYPEVFERGLGLCSGVVPLPHAKRRLRLDDRERVARFARRFAPDVCLVMGDGARLDIGPDGWTASADTQRLHEDGDVGGMDE